MIFINRLKDLREDRDLFQEDIAKILNVGQTTYSAWERGVNEPSITVLITLADFYNVSLDYLVGRTKAKEEVNAKEKAVIRSAIDIIQKMIE